MAANRTLLIDADVTAYQCAASVETAIEWEDGYWTWHCNEDEVKAAIEAQIETFMDALDGDDYKLCLTDSERNFRLDVLPTYKSNRKSVKRPLVLKSIKEWMIEEKGAYFRPRLEGDDVLGILATWKHLKGEKVIVSIDKDLRAIPGLYVRDLETGIVEISEEEADRWHMIQTLAGDPTDGYSGCPGIGLERAKQAVEEMTKLVPYEHTLTRGPRKGEVETRFKEEPTDNLWDVVVSRYEAAGLTEEDALQQARVARILRASDYDFKNKEPILWTP